MRLACPARSPSAMNCAEPAKTVSDISWPCQGCSGPEVTSVPKMTPKGAAPTIIGIVSRAPLASSLSHVGEVDIVRTRMELRTLQLHQRTSLDVRGFRGQKTSLR